LQNREPGGGAAPQLAQMIASFAPQPLQKVDPAGGSCPQWGQVTAVAPGGLARSRRAIRSGVGPEDAWTSPF